MMIADYTNSKGPSSNQCKQRSPPLSRGEEYGTGSVLSIESFSELVNATRTGSPLMRRSLYHRICSSPRRFGRTPGSAFSGFETG